MFRVFVKLSKKKLGTPKVRKGSKIHWLHRFTRARRPLTRRTVVSFRSCSEMTSRRVPVPNPKFARSPSSDDEKDDDDDTKKGVSKQQAKIKDTNKRASKTSSVDEALVVATTTTKKNGPSGKKDAEKKKEALVQPSKILIPQNGDEGPKKWRLADQRRCALNVITRLNHHHHHHHHHHRVKSKEE